MIVLSVFLRVTSLIYLLINLGLPLNGCVVDERFPTLLHRKNDLDSGFGGRQLSTLLDMHLIYFVHLCKARL